MLSPLLWIQLNGTPMTPMAPITPKSKAMSDLRGSGKRSHETHSSALLSA
jgi:hypothetical protein